MRISGFLASLPTLAVAMLLLVYARRLGADDDSVRAFGALFCYIGVAVFLAVGSAQIIAGSRRLDRSSEPSPRRFDPFEDRSDPRHRRP